MHDTPWFHALVWRAVLLGIVGGCDGVDPAAGGAAGLGGAGASGGGAGGAEGGANAAQIVSAFFGLDDALPPQANFLCSGAAGLDGMPVVLSRRVKWTGEALLPSDAFAVEKADGSAASVVCATLAPATEEPERHTILLIGDFGTHPSNPPARVTIVGSLPLEDGGDAEGASTSDVIALPDGPSLVLAESFDPSTLPAGGADDCPDSARIGVVRVAWSGGVSDPRGAPVGEAQREAIRVTLRDAEDAELEVTPDALADANDNDNYLELCLGSLGLPLRVTVEAGAFVDPNGDLNDAQDIAVGGVAP
jgi:hypothetical protein